MIIIVVTFDKTMEKKKKNNTFFPGWLEKFWVHTWSFWTLRIILENLESFCICFEHFCWVFSKVCLNNSLALYNLPYLYTIVKCFTKNLLFEKKYFGAQEFYLDPYMKQWLYFIIVQIFAKVFKNFLFKQK